MCEVGVNELKDSILTNDRLYESKDSLEIENGSFSLSTLLCEEAVVDVGVRDQKLCFS